MSPSPMIAVAGLPYAPASRAVAARTRKPAHVAGTSRRGMKSERSYRRDHVSILWIIVIIVVVLVVLGFFGRGRFSR